MSELLWSIVRLLIIMCFFWGAFTAIMFIIFGIRNSKSRRIKRYRNMLKSSIIDAISPVKYDAKMAYRRSKRNDRLILALLNHLELEQGEDNDSGHPTFRKLSKKKK